MSSPVDIPKRVSPEKYVPVHKRSASSTSSSPVRQTPVSDANNRPQVYSVAELLQLSESPLVQTSLASEQKQGIIDVMSCIPHEPRRRAKNRSHSPTESGRSPSPSLTTTKSRRPSSPTKKAKKSPAPETSSLPKVDTPPSPRPGSSKRRLVETNATTHSDSGRHHHGRRQWGYAPSSHRNEDNWRAHPSLAITV